jgi:hypothetical protein
VLPLALLVLDAVLSEIPIPNNKSEAIIKNAINGTTRGDEVLHQLGCLGGATLYGFVTISVSCGCGLFTWEAVSLICCDVVVSGSWTAIDVFLLKCELVMNVGTLPALGAAIISTGRNNKRGVSRIHHRGADVSHGIVTG